MLCNGIALIGNRDLDTDTTYYFKVRAIDPDGNAGAFSSLVSATTSGSS
ncbi:MAG: fibronectin type III domain-containing protein [Candidatus Methanospirareceae archaeon]